MKFHRIYLISIVVLSLHSLNSIARTESDKWFFSAQLRQKLTYISAPEFNPDSLEAGIFWTQRLTVGGTYMLNKQWAFHASVLSGLQEGVEPSPVERNNLDIYAAYAHYQGDLVAMKIGRQTLKLGSQRLVGWRDGTNIRRTWQGARMTATIQQNWTADWLAMELIEVESEGAFNDNPSDAHRLAGVYNTFDLGQLRWVQPDSGVLDVYYLYANRDSRTTIEGRGHQLRHTLGLRYAGTKDQWYWDWEGAYQFGRQGANDIRAWTFATNTGYRIEASWAPEIMLSVNVASGDKTNGDGRLETFDALYPRGSYFSEAAQLGPANFYNFHPFLILNPTKNLRMFIDTNIYWRLEQEDGVYGPPGNIIRTPGSSASKKVNIAYSAGVEWDVNEKINVSVLGTYSRPQAFLLANTNVPDLRHTQVHVSDIKFVELTLNWTIF